MWRCNGVSLIAETEEALRIAIMGSGGLSHSIIDEDLDRKVLDAMVEKDAETLCKLLGVEAGTEVGDSALGEIGNILGTSYLNALSMMTGLSLLPSPPMLVTDLLGAIVASVLAQTAYHLRIGAPVE